jgi:hypothetical protein
VLQLSRLAVAVAEHEVLWQHGLQLHSTKHSGNSWYGAALQVVSRTSKLTYMWKGMAHLPALLQRLVKEEDQGDFTTLSCCSTPA